LRLGSAQADRAETAEVPGSSRQRPLRILLAEDNVVNQKVAVHLLEKRGHRVVVAGSGREALAILERDPFDLVLMDVQMPELDGFETTAQIRAREKPRGTHLPIVAMTAYAMKGDRERCLAAGMDGYVSKPIHPPELFRMLEEMSPRISAPLPGVTGASSGGAVEVDLEEVRERLGGDEELLREVVALFLEECPRLMSIIQQGVESRDAARIAHAAHTLRGAAANLGARALSQAAQRLEALGRLGDLSHVEEICSVLEQALERITPAFTALQASRTEHRPRSKP
jgi:CheY-like chemotaxis protein